MGRISIREEAFPEIIGEYNSGGKTAAYDCLRSRYGIKHPYFVMKRIKDCGRFTYDPDTADSVFMNLDELCSTTAVTEGRPTHPAADPRPAAMEKLVHELISDRLLILSRYITLDSSTRTILIDQTSLSADGYQVVTH